MQYGAHVVEWVDRKVWTRLWDVHGDHAQHVRDYYLAKARACGWEG